MITTINKQASNTKKLSNFRISTYNAGITTPDKKTVEIIYNSYGIPNLSAVDLGLYGDRNVTLLKLNFKDLLWNTADATNYQISLFVDGNKVDSSFEMDNTHPIVTYSIDTTNLTVGTHEFVVSIIENDKTSGSNIDVGQEVYLCRSFKGTINASDFSEATNIFDFTGISTKGLRRHQIEVMLADDGQFALKQAITSDEKFSTDLGMQYDRFVSYICFNESTDITGKVANLDKYIVFQNLALRANYYVKLNTTTGHQHGTEDTLTAWVPPEVTETSSNWTIYFVGKKEDESIRFVSRSISLAVLPTTIPYNEVNPDRGLLIPVTFKLSFYYKSTTDNIPDAYAILKEISLNTLQTITHTENGTKTYLRQGEQYILELYPSGTWYLDGVEIEDSKIIYTVPKDAIEATYEGIYELNKQVPIQELLIKPSEEEQTFEQEGIDGYKPVIVKPIQTKTLTVDLALADGDQVITPDSGSYIKQLTINKPETLVAANIKKDTTIAGVTGTYEVDPKRLVTEVTTLGEPTKDDPYIVVKDEEVYRRNAVIDTTLPTLYIPETGYRTYYIVKGNTSTYYIVWSKTDNLSIVGRGDSSNSNNIIALITLNIPANNYYTTANSESEAISKITSSTTTYTKSTSDVTFDLASASSTSSSSYSAEATVSLANPPFIKSSVLSKTYVTSNHCYWTTSTEGLISWYVKSTPTEATQSNISFINGNFSDEITPNSYKKLATKEEIDTKLDKVTTPTSANQAYVKNIDGSQGMIPIVQGISGDSIPRRLGDGRLQAKAGTNNDDVVNKKQMDDAIAAAITTALNTAV